MFCRTIKARLSLCHAFSLHIRATQPPEIGAMAKITPLHRVANEKATPSSGLTSLGMKFRNRHVESFVYKNVLELQSSWNTNMAHLPNWTSFGHTYLFVFYCGPLNLDKMPTV
ncbi:hypothetical protein AVEN_238747-1 [Araneus ventricosus]|uniref:Uncharacterized protein n=1 Tax=Araneus ventricosus TaxID=182803 RepID=A0A4Y2RUM9_ARAVE|nr:hypothetical protein AVEN_238747-1 [Araneus ventricosus]